MDLSHALPLAAPPSSPSQPRARLQVADWVPAVEGQTDTYLGLRATGAGRVVVTLVWYDFPADSMAELALVNDLDLAVSVALPDGNAWQLWPNGVYWPDRYNTVERVRGRTGGVGGRG